MKLHRKILGGLSEVFRFPLNGYLFSSGVDFEKNEMDTRLVRSVDQNVHYFQRGICGPSTPRQFDGYFSQLRGITRIMAAEFFIYSTPFFFLHCIWTFFSGEYFLLVLKTIYHAHSNQLYILFFQWGTCDS
jgi:hypothetical protein